MSRPSRSWIIAGLAIVLMGWPRPTFAQGPGHRLVGYYASWSAYDGFKPSQIPADKLTHVTYAFATVTPRHELALSDPDVDAANLADLARLKQRHPALNVMLAVGGQGSGSKHFSAMVGTAANRQTFAASCARLLFQRHPGVFDGLTIDWEFPQGDGDGVPGVKADRERFTALLQTLRTVLDAKGRQHGRRPLLAAALPAGQELLQRFELAPVARSLDYLDCMTFDYATGSATTGHNAPLHGPSPQADSISHTTAILLAAGVPAEKIDIGLPFFGKAWRDVAIDRQQGQFQPGRPDSLDTTWRALTQTALKGGYQPHWDAIAKVPFLTGSSVRRWISYDDPRSLTEKARYVLNTKLGGAFIWHLGADDPAWTLLKAAWKGLWPTTRPS